MSSDRDGGTASSLTDSAVAGASVAAEQARAGGNELGAAASKPEVAVGAAFGCGLLFALLLRKIRS